MAIDKPRIPPLPISEWGEKEKEALGVFVKNDGKRLQSGGESKDKDVSALALWLNHPALARPIFELTRYLLHDSVLPAIDRELLVLRVAVRRNAEYEWAQHVLIAQSLGMSDEQIRRVTEEPVSAQCSAKDQLLTLAADELVESAVLSDATWDGLTQYFSQQEMMEIVTAVGAYDLMAMAFNSFAIPHSDGISAVLEQFSLLQRD